MSIWYAICDFIPLEMLQWDFMRNALLAILIMTPLFGIMSTMIVTGRMSFFSDALGHSAFTGIAIGAICGFGEPTWVAVVFAIGFAILLIYIIKEFLDTKHITVIGYSNTFHTIGNSLIHQLGDRRLSVQDGILGVYM